jgi:hypothetical protein
MTQEIVLVAKALVQAQYWRAGKAFGLQEVAFWRKN